MTMIDTPEGIDFARLLTYRGRFRIELNTGMQSKVSTLAAYNQEFGTNFKTKRKAFKDCKRRVAEAEQRRNDPSPEVLAPEEKSAALEGMTVKELRNMAKTLGMTGYSSLKKADLIAQIEAL